MADEDDYKRHKLSTAFGNLLGGQSAGTYETVENRKARLKKRVFGLGFWGIFAVVTLIVAATYFENKSDPMYARMSGIEKLVGAFLLTFVWGLIPIGLVCWLIYWNLASFIREPKGTVFESRPYQAGVASADHLKGLGISDER